MIEPEPQETIAPDLVARLLDLELRLARLEGQKEFISKEPIRAMNEIMSSNPQMTSVNAELKALIESGKLKITS